MKCLHEDASDFKSQKYFLFLLIHYKCIRIFAVVISCARMKPVPHSSLNTLPSSSVFFFLFPDVSLQLPWLTANSFITGHKRQVLHLKGRHPPSPPAWVKNRPAGIAHRTRCSISTKWRPAGPKRWARSLSSRGRGDTFAMFFIVLLHSAQLWQNPSRGSYPQIQGK